MRTAVSVLALLLVATPAAAQQVPSRDAVLAVLKSEASAEVARLKNLDAHPELPHDSVTGLTANWVSGTFLIGAERLSQATDVPEVREYTLRAAARFNYALAGAEAPVNMINANNVTIGDVYESVYQRTGQAGVILPLQQRLDYTLPYLTKTPVPQRLTWWWCDALFMAPAVYVRMSQITGDRKYIDAMDVQWWRVYDRLWDDKEHLFARDERFIDRRDGNGKKIFWSRGEGWVIAGLARMLEAMPADYPSRPKYVKVYQQMAARLIELQGEDGLWRSSLIDPAAFPEPETSGTALETYALAFGVNHGLLDRKTYLPHVLKAWAGLNAHILPSGILGQVQTAGDQPVPTMPDTTTMYASGAFIMAGLEIAAFNDPQTPLPVAVPAPKILGSPMAFTPPAPRPADPNASAFEQSEARRKIEERQATRSLAYDPVTDDPDFKPGLPGAK